ncbi:hypothetical protein QOZ80_5BG0431460 [Eleusine coracana subsp. coracana]|nr:hypothetical protein QOZ80_5BG0431460 [Eleusine coracana subsp. coracana]
MLQDIILHNSNVQTLNKMGLAELVLTGIWYIWWERRQLVHGENLQPAARAALSIGTLRSNYMRARTKKVKKEEGWRKTSEGKLMLNVDASFDADPGTGGTGAIIRDSNGVVIAASRRFLAHTVDAAMAEAYALKEGLLLTQQIGANKIIIQTGCMEVVETMNTGGFSATTGAAIYDVCIEMWRGLDDIVIEHCPREANKVAHELARHGFPLKSDCNWVDEPPSNCLGLLIDDVTIFDNQ